MSDESIEQLRRQLGSLKKELIQAESRAAGIRAEIAKVEYRLMNHQEYKPKKSEPFGHPHGLPNEKGIAVKFDLSGLDDLDL